jgi:hypothetical protein
VVAITASISIARRQFKSWVNNRLNTEGHTDDIFQHFVHFVLAARKRRQYKMYKVELRAKRKATFRENRPDFHHYPNAE